MRCRAARNPRVQAHRGSGAVGQAAPPCRWSGGAGTAAAAGGSAVEQRKPTARDALRDGHRTARGYSRATAWVNAQRLPNSRRGTGAPSGRRRRAGRRAERPTRSGQRCPARRSPRRPAAVRDLRNDWPGVTNPADEAGAAHPATRVAVQDVAAATVAAALRARRAARRQDPTACSTPSTKRRCYSSTSTAFDSGHDTEPTTRSRGNGDVAGSAK